jgi:hypothetical protein
VDVVVVDGDGDGAGTPGTLPVLVPPPGAVPAGLHIPPMPPWSHGFAAPDWSLEVVVVVVVVVLVPVPASGGVCGQDVTSGLTRKSLIPACFSALLRPSLACW